MHGVRFYRDIAEPDCFFAELVDTVRMENGRLKVDIVYGRITAKKDPPLKCPTWRNWMRSGALRVSERLVRRECPRLIQALREVK